MFRQIRFQTGEVSQVASEMKSGGIPCLEVIDHDEFESFVKQLHKFGIEKSQDILYDKNARDRIKEPEFEFRAAFYLVEVDELSKVHPDIMYIDVYYEPDFERTYDSVGEI